MKRALFLLLLALFSAVSTAFADDMEITPFRTVNQSPLLRIFGFPSETGSVITPSGKLSAAIMQDVANNFAASSSKNESISLDGESWIWTASLKYGFLNRFEAGVELPVVLQGGGVFDGFIDGWHKFFSLPRGGRNKVKKNQLNYSYTRDGVQKLYMNDSGTGIGDIMLTAGMQLYDEKSAESRNTLALRSSLKLPTGESGSFRGSGSTDFSLYLAGNMTNFTEWGSLAVYGSVGGMALTDGDVLKDQQKNLAGFGTFGVGWGPAEWISFKVQLGGNTSMYGKSSLDELSNGSLVLMTGGAIKLPGNCTLDIAVSEDIAVNTAPDVALHLGLTRTF